MLVRIVSSIVLLPLLISIIVINGFVLKLALAIISVIGMYEFYKAFSEKIKQVHYIGFLFACAYLFFIERFLPHFILLLCAFIIFILFVLVFFHPVVNIIDCCVTFFGFVYVCVLISNIFLVRNYIYGDFIVWLIFICAWCSDTGAYFVGVKFGKHKLTPVLSPNKTVEGAFGGILFTGLASLLYGFVVSKYSDNLIIYCTVIGIVGSIFAQFGDLAASAIKRYANIKDYGNIMPGHGGVLDRFDSVIFTAPVICFLMNLYEFIF